MKKTLSLFVLVTLASSGFCDTLEQARRAYDDGIPVVAIPLLRDALAGKLSASERAEATQLLAQAYLAQGDTEAALTLLKDNNSPEAAWLRGNALVAGQRWEEALAQFHSLDTMDAKMAAADVLEKLNRRDEAITLLDHPDLPTRGKLRLAELCLDAGDPATASRHLQNAKTRDAGLLPWKTALDARAALALGDSMRAVGLLESLLNQTSQLSPGVEAQATLTLAQARESLSGADAADEVLESFIAQHQRHPMLGNLFAALDALYEKQENPPENALAQWAKDAPSPCREFAAFYLAKADIREKNIDMAIRRLSRFAGNQPGHPLAAEAQLLRASLLLQQEKPSDAAEACEAAMRSATNPTQKADAELLAGVAQFQLGEFVLATRLFRNAAASSPDHKERAVFNTALAWLRQGNREQFLAASQELSAFAPESPLNQRLALEEALTLARRQDPDAEKLLQKFVQDHPNDIRAREARIALAELAFLEPMPRMAEASHFLQIANETPGRPVDDERAAALQVFLADAPEHRQNATAEGQNATAEDAAMRFLERFPNSAQRAAIRMKLGQIKFRAEDFLGAQQQFETLVKESPDSPLGEAALYLAGQSAILTMSNSGAERALSLFGDVVKRNGQLKLPALQQQAIVQTKLGAEDKALVIYEAVLTEQPPPELRAASLAGKGDLLMQNAPDATADIARLEKALATWEELAALEAQTAMWRNQALYKKAQCLLKLSRDDDALVALFTVLDTQLQPGQSPEYYWFYTAGFEAGRKLETVQDWRSAIGIYQKLAALGGPRSEEAKNRAQQLRLEHFVWD